MQKDDEAEGSEAGAATETSRTTDDRSVMAIIVVNFDSSGLLEKHLVPLSNAGDAFEIVVVDNFSAKSEQNRLRALADRHGWHLVLSATNRGFGAGVNSGTEVGKSLGCSSFLFLNPDARIDALAAQRIHEHLIAHPMNLISPRIVDSSGRTFFAGAQLEMRRGHTRRGFNIESDTLDLGPSASINWVSGACVGIRAELFELVGGMAEDYFLYWEDIDLSLRALRKGARLVIDENVTVIHDEGGTQVRANAREKSLSYYFYNCRNRLLFAAHNLPNRGKLRWLIATPRESWEILLRGGRRQLLRSPKPLAAAITGSCAGVWRLITTSGSAPAANGGSPGADGQNSPSSILVVHPSAELYGSDRVMLETVAALRERSVAVCVVLPGPGPLVAPLRDLGAQVEYCRLAVLRKSAMRPLGFLRLAGSLLLGLVPGVRLIRTHAQTGIYVSTLTLPSWLLLGRLLGKRTTCHVHEAEQSAPRAVRALLALPVNLAHTVVINSGFSERVLCENFARLREKCVVVYNGVPGPSESAIPLKAERLGALRLIFLGRLSPRKGPQVALAAAIDLLKSGVDVRLNFLGSVFPGYEWFETELRSMVAASDFADRFEFLGFDANIWPHLAASDVVLVPSVADEPFGNSAVEAVLAERPLIVSRTTGLQEAAAGYESALFVTPDDSAAIVAAVNLLVAEWPRISKLTIPAGELATRRHAPAVYRGQMRKILLPM